MLLSIKFRKVSAPGQAERDASGGSAWRARVEDPSAAAPSRVPSSEAPTNSHRTAEYRLAPRRPAAAVPAITGLRAVPPSAAAILINISTSGLLAECDQRLNVGTRLTIFFEGTFTPRSIEARIVRTAVSSISSDGRLRYVIGLAFSAPLPLEDEAAASVPADPPEPGSEPTASTRRSR